MSILNEISSLVKWILPESVCRLCGYDNPYMDDVPDYVCRQCVQRAEKWGTGLKSEPSKSPYGKMTLDGFKEKFDEMVKSDLISVAWGTDSGDCYTYVEGQKEFDDFMEEAMKQLGGHMSEDFIELENYIDDWLRDNDEGAMEDCRSENGDPYYDEEDD